MGRAGPVSRHGLEGDVDVTDARVALAVVDQAGSSRRLEDHEHADQAEQDADYHLEPVNRVGGPPKIATAARVREARETPRIPTS
jgi:hypothetical protein